MRIARISEGSHHRRLRRLARAAARGEASPVWRALLDAARRRRRGRRASRRPRRARHRSHLGGLLAARIPRYRRGMKLDPQPQPPSRRLRARPARPRRRLDLLCRRGRSRAVPGPALAPHRPVPRRPRAGGRPASPASRSTSTSAASTAASGRRTDAGRTWQPIFDGQPIGIDRRPRRSRPRTRSVIYVGTGEADMRSDIAQGDGVYKSTRRRPHLGARRPRATAQQIGRILVDPRDPERVFVAALGHPYGPNAERGVFRSTRRRRELAEGARSRTTTPAPSTSPSSPATRA